MVKDINVTGQKDTRSGFGDGIYELGQSNPNVVALTADLAGSLKLNAFIKEASQSEQWQAQIAYSDSDEAVSTDFVGCEKVAIWDAKSTLAQDNRAVMYLWYDNEMGYSTQVLRVAETMAKNA